MKNIAKAAGPAELETRKILDGSLFSQADKGLLKLLKSSLENPKQRERLLDILESRAENPLPLSKLINVFEKFSDVQGQLEKELTKEDIKFIQFVVKYFEDWFYRGEWAMISEKPEAKKDEKAYAYFSVPAGIINMITKIKENPKFTSKIGGFDPEKLTALQNKVHWFASNLLANNPHFNKPALDSPGELQKARDVFKISEKSVKNATGPQGHVAGDLYLLKTCLVAAEMMRRQAGNGSGHNFIPDTKMPTAKNEYITFDFSGGDDPKYNSMHYPTHRLPYCKFIVAYLLSSPESQSF